VYVFEYFYEVEKVTSVIAHLIYLLLVPLCYLNVSKIIVLGNGLFYYT